MSKFSFRSPPVDVALSVGPVTLNWEEIFRQWEMFLADTHPSCKNSLRTKTESISWLSHSFSLLRWFLLREEEVISSNHSSYCRLTYLNIEFLNVKKGFWSVWENVWSGYWSVGKIETHVLFCFAFPIPLWVYQMSMCLFIELMPHLDNNTSISHLKISLFNHGHSTKLKSMKLILLFCSWPSYVAFETSFADPSCHQQEYL